jgi:DNA modification methylase
VTAVGDATFTPETFRALAGEGGQTWDETKTAQQYARLLDSKRRIFGGEGKAISGHDINPKLFEFQRDIVMWAAKKGRGAIFADCGLGKTFMQLEWARLMDVPTLIIAPLGVARQTVGEAAKLSMTAPYCRSQREARDRITVTNYEMLDEFDASAFGAVVIDESSILKSIDGKTKAKLLKMFKATPYRLCCTATPAPNDIAEIANHSEFLGIMPRPELLATFFVHDDNGWRLKRHAVEPFHRWLSSWSMSLRMPSDLGYPDDGFILPPLQIELRLTDSDYCPQGMLFPVALKGIVHRAEVRRATLSDRVAAAAELVTANGDQWLVWCGLDDEGRALHKTIPDSILVEGRDTRDSKADALASFAAGESRILITKPRIAGFGMNFQNAHRMVFVGLGDSYEQYYHCIRRSWRFGQQHPVEAHIILSDVEEPIYRNVLRKEQQAQESTRRLIAHVSNFERAELQKPIKRERYMTEDVRGDNFHMMLGDSVERLKVLPDASIDLSIFSPPFLSLYTYTDSERDLGNSRTPGEFFQHFGFIIRELRRVTKPGRLAAVHVAQITSTLNADGHIGLKDFRGKTIEAFEADGWIYHGEACIDKNPQAQAIRTHSKALLFAQLRKDASWLRPALADYILVFRSLGENAVPVHPDISNDDWIEWAHPIWYGIRETDTLNVAVARGNDDERHICPLQLGTIERCVRLWSNPGETILSPFAGIGSEGYQAILLGRKFIGIELKRQYFKVAVKNLKAAEDKMKVARLL